MRLLTKYLGHQTEWTEDLAVSPLCQDKVNNADFMGRVPSISRWYPCPHKVPAIFAQYLSAPILLLNLAMTFKRAGAGWSMVTLHQNKEIDFSSEYKTNEKPSEY